ncbi:M1 family metallopeptidase [Paenibacillus sp. JX-17]|uniref:M1 family metallopeptidase n=1 Tax=Paenibacillus lacisoli TaxID=3064525 RepID=A0ABT9CM08_9BACL|nr:M1 family metallopeptidase [Paenibacillus sp. JX-17]MDO7908681.1 M1 family metallopeptidase [Paenibacillus sp. JX-17]
MTPFRAKVIIMSVLALCLTAGSAGWYMYSSSPTTQALFAVEKGKPSAPQAAAPESVQQPQAEVLSDRIVEYHMDVALADEGVLKGTETLTWKHPGKKTVNELYFHLYPNAFASMDTTFMKETGGKLRGDTMPPDGFGSMSILSMKTADGLSLMPRIQYIQPDDGNIKDKTLMKVRLPKPVKAGESVTLSIQFEVKLPKVFARMGKAGSFIMAGQWYPKIAVYERAGERGRTEEGWNAHQYHGNTEFYSDFGIYSARIRVPSNYIVAASGFPTRQAEVKNGSKIYQFYADDVHDFAWSASPDFVVAEEPFSATNIPGVRIKLYLDPAHKDLKERYFYAAKAALSNYSKWYGSYPYSTLSIVVPPKEGNGAGGMEYPTLITAFGASDANPGYSLERTVVHEIGHQYFYGMIASNEVEEAWLDEGFTSYAEDRVMEQEYGLSPNLPMQAGYVSSPASLTQSAWKYGSQERYAQNAYIRGKLVLSGIEQQVGRQTMDKIMRTYTQKYRFRHPSSADFQKVVERVTNKSWSGYFNDYIYGAKMADFAVDHIEVTPSPGKGKENYESKVVISKRGGDYPKIPVLFTFKDGHEMYKSWNGQGSTVTFNLKYSSPVSTVTVDPLHQIVLENKHINNYLKAEVDEKVATRWNLGVTKLIETLLGSLSW